MANVTYENRYRGKELVVNQNIIGIEFMRGAAIDSLSIKTRIDDETIVHKFGGRGGNSRHENNWYHNGDESRAMYISNISGAHYRIRGLRTQFIKRDFCHTITFTLKYEDTGEICTTVTCNGHYNNNVDYFVEKKNRELYEKEPREWAVENITFSKNYEVGDEIRFQLGKFSDRVKKVIVSLVDAAEYPHPQYLLREAHRNRCDRYRCKDYCRCFGDDYFDCRRCGELGHDEAECGH